MKRCYLIFISLICFFNICFSQVSKEKLALIQSTYASTPRGELWEKIQIKNDSAYYQKAIPSAGSWGKMKSWKITDLLEQRDENTGEKFYNFIIDGDILDIPTVYRILFFPKTGQYFLSYGDSGRIKLKKVNSKFDPWL